MDSKRDGIAEMTNLERAFDEAMMEIYRRAKLECNYTPSVFHNMLSKYRGVKTAKQLINSRKVSDGYTRLYELGRLDLTVEAVIYDAPKWYKLFEEEEIIICKKRLNDYRYFET
jgi:hypothetical protein